MKRVADPNVRVRVLADGSGVDLTAVKMAMNPFCEIAVEEAIRLREAGKASEVLVVSIGASGAQDTLRAALAMGADRAVLIETEVMPEPLGVAKALKEIALAEQPGLIILGKQAIDDDSNQTGQMLAALLGWPQATFVSQVEIGESAAIVRRRSGRRNRDARIEAPVCRDNRLAAQSTALCDLAEYYEGEKEAAGDFGREPNFPHSAICGSKC